MDSRKILNHGFVCAALIALALVWVCPASATVSTGPDSLLARAAEYYHAAQLVRAHSDYQQAISLFEQQGRRDAAYAEALFDLGVVEERSGDLAAAALFFRRSLAAFESLSTTDDQAISLALEGLAAVLLRQENFREATPLLDRAMAIRSRTYGADHPQRARLYALYALAAQLSGDVETTEDWYYRALMAYRRIHGNVHPFVAQIIQNIGTFYTDTGNFQAEIMFQQAADVAKMLYGPNHPLRALSLTNFGRLRWLEGNYPAAEGLLRQALDIFDNLGLANSPARGMALYHLGRTLLAEEDFAAAETVLSEAVRVYEVNWWRSGNDDERSLATRSPYGLLAVARLHLGDESGALHSFAAYQGRLASLAERLRALPFALATQRDSLAAELANREDELTRLEALASQQGGQPPRQERALARSRLATAEEAWQKFQGQLSLDHSDQFTVAGVTEDLGAGEAAVGWLDVETQPHGFESWAFVLRSGGRLEWLEMPAAADGRTPLQQTATALAEIRSGQTVDLTGTDALRATHLAPLKTALDGVRRLVVVPSGALAGFPVDLLVSDNLDLVYALNLDGLRWPDATLGRARGEARVLVLADPVFSAADTREVPVASGSRSLPEAGVLRDALSDDREAIARLPRLAGTRLEAEALAGVYPRTKLLTGPEATKVALENLAQDSELGRFDIIHLATHAVIDAEIPGRSALVLCQTNLAPGQNGLLTVHEISRRWHLNAELVTLSACATGLGRRLDGEGFVGFSQALIGAGARNILVSMWPVDDRATGLFMAHFYQVLAGTSGVPVSPAKALRLTRHWLRDYTTPMGTQPFAAPRFWAGFIMFSAEP